MLLAINLKCSKISVLNKLSSFFFTLFILSSCGYRFSDEFSSKSRPTLTIPYVEEDESGFLTDELVKAFTYSGLFDLVSSGGEYRLEVAVVGSTVDTIGYRINPQKVDGEVRKNLLATEGRNTITLESTLYRGKECLYGPCQISSDTEFDYVDGDSIQDLTFTNSKGRLVTVLPFSFGQLEPKESAQEAALTPLYRNLSQKIVNLCVIPIAVNNCTFELSENCL